MNVFDSTKEYINNVLNERRNEFGGKHVCPFAAPELSRDRLMIAEVSDNGLVELINQFKDSQYDSALFIIKEDIPSHLTKGFQIFVNRVLRKQGLEEYKNICFNPNDQVEVHGYNPRSLAPYFMINIAHREALSQASKSLKKTNYYDKLPDEYLSFLKVKKQKKV